MLLSWHIKNYFGKKLQAHFPDSEVSKA